MPRNVIKVDGTIAVDSGTGETYATINYPHPINVLRLVCINAPSGAFGDITIVYE